MNNLGILAWILGFIPGIAWMVYVYRKDIHEPEPLGWVVLLFILGALVVFPVALIESWMTSRMGISEPQTVTDAARVSWFVAGFVEELAKMAVVLAVVAYRKTFDEPMDGIVYASAVALGFASAENVLFIGRFGNVVILFRAPLATLGHLLFSSIWGYAIGNARFDHDHRLSLLGKGFLLSAFFHGLYNFLIFTQVFAAFAVYLVIMTLRKMLVRMVDSAQERSPFKPELEDTNL